MSMFTLRIGLRAFMAMGRRWRTGSFYFSLALLLAAPAAAQDVQVAAAGQDASGYARGLVGPSVRLVGGNVDAQASLLAGDRDPRVSARLRWTSSGETWTRAQVGTQPGYDMSERFRRQLWDVTLSHDRPVGPLRAGAWSRATASGRAARYQVAPSVYRRIGDYQLFADVGGYGVYADGMESPVMWTPDQYADVGAQVRVGSWSGDLQGAVTARYGAQGLPALSASAFVLDALRLRVERGFGSYWSVGVTVTTPAAR